MKHELSSHSWRVADRLTRFKPAAAEVVVGTAIMATSNGGSLEKIGIGLLIAGAATPFTRVVFQPRKHAQKQGLNNINIGGESK